MSPPFDPSPVKLVRKRLEADDLEPHLRALAAEARAVEVRIKGQRAHQSDATTESLEALARRLVAGEIVAVQVRFELADGWWADTLMRAEKGFRLVRMKEELPPDPQAP